MDSYIIAALIALIGVIISVIGSSVSNYCINKLVNNKNLDAQKEISERNIDVNLKAKARIEWIQSVRIAASELISFYSVSLLYKVDNVSEFMEKRNEIQLKTNILIMYFGNDSKINNLNQKEIFFREKDFHLEVSDKKREQLLDLKSNEGKNDSLVRYLRVLKEYYDFYVERYSNSEYRNLINSKDSLESEMCLNQDEPDLEYDEEGEAIGILGYSRKFDKSLEESLKSKSGQMSIK